MAERWPSYVKLFESGELQQRARRAVDMLACCRLCPRNCEVNRLEGEIGFCRAGREAMVSSYNPHFGEERPLVGSGGSGTIFLTHCNLRCLFCQNWEISHLGQGVPVSPRRLAEMMLRLQELGCHNINLVTPTHYLPQILQALPIAVEKGLRLPLVWNCGGYESVEALRLLDGIVDIYMPDAKFADRQVAGRLCAAPDYPERMQEALVEMHRQVGDLQIDERGLATRGLLVRHLVLPNGQAGTAQIAQFVHDLSPNTYINVMAQYRPCYRAHADELIGRRLTAEEYREAVAATLAAGLRRLDGRLLSNIR